MQKKRGKHKNRKKIKKIQPNKSKNIFLKTSKKLQK